MGFEVAPLGRDLISRFAYGRAVCGPSCPRLGGLSGSAGLSRRLSGGAV